MSKDSITLSPKHGLNPSITHCEVCGKEIGIALLGRLKGNVEAPKEVAMGLCDECKNVIKQGGVFIIEVRDGESGNNPYRTGRLIGIKKEAAARIFKEVHPIAYMEHSMFEQVFGNVKFQQ